MKEDYGKEADGKLSCCASSVVRGVALSSKDVDIDDRIKLGSCRNFNDSIQVDSEFTLIECTRESKKKIYVDIHATIVPTNATLNKMADATKLRPIPPSVMLLGLDSSSRMNIYRAAPKLVAALKEVGAVEMTSYNKVGDNTLPNLLPILAGISLPDAEGKTASNSTTKGYGCIHRKRRVFDDCPFVWEDLSRRGYVTMLAEDVPNLTIFNYSNRGFRNQPTDHYLRTYFVAADKNLKKTKRNNISWCYANKASLTRLLEYARSFVDTYVSRAPTFSLVYITGLGHENAADIEIGDAELAAFVRHVVDAADASAKAGGGGMFLAVFSDHGSRFGKLRQSPLGWLEERVPFMFIRPILPTSPDRKKSPSVAVASLYPSLIENAKRLASPFDLHATLVTLLFGEGGRGGTTSCTQCYDLLREVVPEARTCADAAIPDNWCACMGEENRKMGADGARDAAFLAVEHVNWLLTDEPMCSNLTLGSIKSAVRRMLLADNKGRKKLNILVVTFTTLPGDALFEATLAETPKGGFQVSSELSRLNRYGNQSWCVNDAVKKLYCYCI